MGLGSPDMQPHRPAAPEIDEPCVLSEGPGWVRFHAATLAVELHRGETEGYKHNISNEEDPAVYVLLRFDEEGDDDAPRPDVVTVCPHEAQAFLESAGTDERVRVWHLETGNQIGIAGEGKSEPKPWLESSHPGARLFRKCALSHSLIADGPRRSGPHFAGLFDRRAGTVHGYKYSATLAGADFVSNAETLSALFNEGPDAFNPGTKMPIQQLPHSEQLVALIDYMREFTAPVNGTTRPAE